MFLCCVFDRSDRDYRQDPNKSGGGTQSVTCPPTAHMVQSIPSLAVAFDTLGEYKWRHRGDFSISTLNPPKPLQKLGKLNNFFSQILIQIWPFEGVKGGN